MPKKEWKKISIAFWGFGPFWGSCVEDYDCEMLDFALTAEILFTMVYINLDN